MKQIIVINGEAGSGKDLFVTLCNELVQEKTGRDDLVWNYSAIDKVKEIAVLCGWDGKKTPKSRKFLSDLKDLTDEFSNLSSHSIDDKINEFYKSDAQILFLHAREPEQIEKLTDTYGAYSLLIRRNNYSTDPSNHADKNVYNFSYDFQVKNPGDTMENYKKEVSRWLKTAENCFSAIEAA